MTEIQQLFHKWTAHRYRVEKANTQPAHAHRCWFEFSYFIDILGTNFRAIGTQCMTIIYRCMDKNHHKQNLRFNWKKSLLDRKLYLTAPINTNCLLECAKWAVQVRKIKRTNAISTCHEMGTKAKAARLGGRKRQQMSKREKNTLI